MAAQRCPGCGTELEESQTACPDCGAELGASADVTAAFAPVTGDDQVPMGEVPVGGGPVLVVKKGPDAGERFALATDVVSVGRDPGSDIFLNDITVSRRHARIERATGGFTLVDVGSLNGTYVNGERVDRRLLVSEDEIQIGKFRLVFCE
jgi:pSer/pThr/pTyr-binding forkhead associated (FHA) protein